MYPTNPVNLAQARGIPRSSYQLSPRRDCIQRARQGLAQASLSRSGETTLAQTSGIRLGEPSN